eukprot:gene10600-biopygen7736
MEAVSQSKKSPPTAIQEQRIKELESQVNLLVSLAAQKKSVSQPVQALSASNLHAPISQVSNPALQPQISGKSDALQNYLVAQQHDQRDVGETIAANVIAAINANFANPQQQGFRNAGKPWQPRGNYGGPRGHNLRTTDGQPICNKCRRVGHVARNCQESPARYNNFGPPPPQSRPFVIDVRNQSVTFSNNNIVDFASKDVPPLVTDVAVANTTVIDAHSEVILPACLTSCPAIPVTGLIEATPKLNDQHHILAAVSLSSSDLNESNQSKASRPCTENNNLLASFKSLPSPSISTAQNQELAEFLRQYEDVFAATSLDLGHTTVIKHEIDTGDAGPIKQPPYRVSQAQRAEIEQQISNMLEQNVINVWSSPWSSPVVLVKKKDGTTRFCVDYRKLNAVTRKDSYPLPRIDDALDSLTGSKYFTTLDLQSGYHQVAMHPDSKDKTAFISHAGLYEYNVMSFGLTNAPPSFQRLMTRVLHGLDWKICLIYIDDIIVFSSTFEDHLTRLGLVFDRLRAANLKLKRSKCHFARSSVNFLGFVVSSEGLLPDPDKLDAVKSFPTPTSVKSIRSFLGLCNYYRRFVQNFAKIVSPLNRLTRKDVAFEWSPECAAAFQELKHRLCSSPILAYPDFTQPFHLYTDASQFALGYILGQKIDGREFVVAYGGRELNQAEKNYSTTEREALAVVDGIRRYQPYLSMSKFYVHTDHSSLSWLMRVKDPTGRLARWSLQLQQYDFEIIHRAGTANANADALSRRTYSLDALTSDVIHPHSLPLTVVDQSCPSIEQLYQFQRQDNNLYDIIRYLVSKELPSNDLKARSILLTIDWYFINEHGILCHLWTPGGRRVKSLVPQVVIPASLRHDILVSCHDDATAGHLGAIKTYEKIRSRYYWHGMFKTLNTGVVLAQIAQ